MDLDCKEVKRLKELVPYKTLAPTPNEIINYIEHLQSNWNSLREHIDYQLKHNVGSSIDSTIRNHVYQEIKDNMNELEGKDKE